MAQFTYDRLGVSIVAVEGKVAVNGVAVDSFELSELQEALKAARRTAEIGERIELNIKRRAEREQNKRDPHDNEPENPHAM